MKTTILMPIPDDLEITDEFLSALEAELLKSLGMAFEELADETAAKIVTGGDKAAS